ncbi:hypothetical protein niasHT_010439 [Heterodera trifolii]|uniref:Uncharacterized protein n=1 Tax=Heterodera trifolii TaxID=157864 RepID=A0ABD2MAN8_9BILA
MDKLLAVELPFKEFGRKECQAMNGTTEHNSCDGNRCNGRNEKQSSSEATTTRSAETESRVITNAETNAVSYDGTKENTTPKTAGVSAGAAGGRQPLPPMSRSDADGTGGTDAGGSVGNDALGIVDRSTRSGRQNDQSNGSSNEQ